MSEQTIEATTDTSTTPTEEVKDQPQIEMKRTIIMQIPFTAIRTETESGKYGGGIENVDCSIIDKDGYFLMPDGGATLRAENRDITRLTKIRAYVLVNPDWWRVQFMATVPVVSGMHVAHRNLTYPKDAKAYIWKGEDGVGWLDADSGMTVNFALEHYLKDWGVHVFTSEKPIDPLIGIVFEASAARSLNQYAPCLLRGRGDGTAFWFCRSSGVATYDKKQAAIMSVKTAISSAGYQWMIEIPKREELPPRLSSFHEFGAVIGSLALLAPKNKALRALITTRIGTPVPDEIETTQALVDWVETNFLISRPEKDHRNPVAIRNRHDVIPAENWGANLETAPTTLTRPLLSIRASASETITGRCSFSGTRSGSYVSRWNKQEILDLMTEFEVESIDDLADRLYGAVTEDTGRIENWEEDEYDYSDHETQEYDDLNWEVSTPITDALRLFIRDNFTEEERQMLDV